MYELVMLYLIVAEVTMIFFIGGDGRHVLAGMRAFRSNNPRWSRGTAAALTMTVVAVSMLIWPLFVYITLMSARRTRRR